MSHTFLRKKTNTHSLLVNNSDTFVANSAGFYARAQNIKLIRMLKSSTPIRRIAVLLLLIASLFCSTLVSAQTAVQPQGDGTAESPYLISNWQELYWISQTGESWESYFLQTADIDLTLTEPNIKTWDNGAGWTPIAFSGQCFNGKYDGGGYTINGLYIYRLEGDYQGLFYHTGIYSEIVNLGVTGAEVHASKCVGILVGVNEGTISQCFTSGVVSAKDEAGGFVGRISNGTISNCFSRANITRHTGTNSMFGAFGGSIDEGYVTNCYVTGNIYETTGTIMPDVLYAIPYSEYGNSTIRGVTGMYWDTQTQEVDPTSTVKKSTVEMQTQSTYNNWDFNTVWAIDPQINAGYPYLKNNNTTFINKAEAILLENVFLMDAIRVSGTIISLGNATNATCGFIINSSANITLSAGGHIAIHELGTFTAKTDIETTFTGLMANTKYYVCAYATNEHGTFYGKAVPIKTLGQPSAIPQGSGTAASPYLISNWKELYYVSQIPEYWSKEFLQTADIDLTEAVPSIKTWDTNAGWTPIGNSETKFSGKYDGGGHFINGLYINRPKSDYQAFFGYTEYLSNITRLGITGADITARSYAGVFVGNHLGTISYSYTSGTIKAESAGGFAGHVDNRYLGYSAQINNSFSRTNIIGDYDYGGFACNSEYGFFKNCYAAGRLNYTNYADKANTGFLSDDFMYRNSVMTGNYWDTQTTGQPYTDGIAYGKNSAEMKTQETFVGWDFTDTWAIDPQINGGYPYLKNSSTAPLNIGDVVLDEAISTMDAVKVSGWLMSLGGSASAVCGFLIGKSSDINISATGHIMKHDLGTFTATGAMSALISGLMPKTNYYICAYTTNATGTNYSPIKQFTTTEQPSAIPQGTGSYKSPFLISNWQELYWVSQNPLQWSRYFQQTADIDLAEAIPKIDTWDGNSGWTPIGNYTTRFRGKYYGEGHIINGLYINRPTSDNQALFGQTENCNITNLGVTSATVLGRAFVGAFVGTHDGTISKCFTTGRVEALESGGGFAGKIYSYSEINNSYSRTDVFGEKSKYRVSGFAYDNNGNISKCYAIGIVLTRDQLSSTNNYWDPETSRTINLTLYGATVKTIAEMKTQATFVGWDFTNIWALDPQVNGGYPYLRINNISQLAKGEVTIHEATVTRNAIDISGTLISLGNSPSTKCGFLINRIANINLKAGGYIAQKDLGEFTTTGDLKAQISGLEPNTDYYYCAYSTNSLGTIYSNVQHIKTTEQTALIPQGAGTVASPYLISNWQELYWISQNPASWDKHFLQTADIDLSLAVPYIRTWDTTAGWTPIGNYIYPFSGSYDGGGNVINGLYINRFTANLQALFGVTSATSSISMLGLTDANVSSLDPLVYSNSGTISQCFSQGNVMGDINNSRCYEWFPTLTNMSYSFSRINVVYTLPATLNSNMRNTVQPNCSYSILNQSTFSDQSLDGNTFLGWFYTTPPYTDLNIRNSAQMQDQGTYTGWDFTDKWTINPDINGGYPYLAYPNFEKALSKPEIKVGADKGHGDRFADKLLVSLQLLSHGPSDLVGAGIVIDTLPIPSIEHSRRVDTDITELLNGEINLLIDKLDRNTVHYIRAFAINEAGIAYSAQIKVQTLPIEPIAPLGTGEEADPYRISTLEHLYWISDQTNRHVNDFSGKYFRQTNDIDVSETKLWNEGQGWEPIGNTLYSSDLLEIPVVAFNGRYDGAGHTISNLHIKAMFYSCEDNSALYSVGFWGTVDYVGSIEGVTIENADISVISPESWYVRSHSDVGIIAGMNLGNIVKCGSRGTISSTAGESIGGLVGENMGTISSSFSKCKSLIYGYVYGGGLVAWNMGNIDNCYALSDGFRSSFIYQNGGLISNSYSVGNSEYGFCYINSVGGISGSFWDSIVSIVKEFRIESDTSAIGLTTADMKTTSTFVDAGWDFLGETTNGTNDIWAVHPKYNNGYPILVWEAPNMTYLGGSVYYDRDKDGSFNHSDVTLGGIKVELLPEGTITGTARDGSYLFYTAPGDYTVRVIPKEPFYKGKDELEIPVQAKFLEDTLSSPVGLYGTDVYDFSLNLATVWTRCASEVPVWAIVENKSYVPANIALNIGLDPKVTLVSSTVPQDSTGADGKKYFRLANMQPFESRVVELTVSVPAASIDSILYTSSISHSGKVVAADSVRNLIRCSYDPNEVQVIPGGLTEKGYVPMGQELTYLVRFQNTGNDTAFMVDIRDTLAPSLDPLSFEMLASSHEMRYFIERNGALRFLFKDINLEDSTSNEPASHGFVLFKVKPLAEVTPGTRAGLTAHIYFDSNPAVVTNTAVSTFTDQYTKFDQSIDLSEGWNLVSFYVQPGDNAIENALNSCIEDIESVKTGDAFYSADQPEWLNSLKTVNGGQAYLIKAKRDTKLTVNGLLVFKPFEHKLNKGWNMVGCPVKTDVAIDPMLKNKPVTEAKDFEGFWRPTTPAGNMINFEPGKGYFIKSNQPMVLPW